jgi:hypothetical protein
MHEGRGRGRREEASGRENGVERTGSAELAGKFRVLRPYAKGGGALQLQLELCPLSFSTSATCFMAFRWNCASWHEV